VPPLCKQAYTDSPVAGDPSFSTFQEFANQLAFRPSISNTQCMTLGILSERPGHCEIRRELAGLDYMFQVFQMIVYDPENLQIDVVPSICEFGSLRFHALMRETHGGE
jgi:hypothetical protein